MKTKLFLFQPLIILIVAVTPVGTTFGQIQKSGLKTIIIDAGHGLPHAGAKGKHSTEADLNLAIALKLGKQLQDVLPDCKIIYTRTDGNLPNGLTDKNAANRYRAKMANDSSGNLFICIHCNASPPQHHSEFTGYTHTTYYRHG